VQAGRFLVERSEDGLRWQSYGELPTLYKGTDKFTYQHSSLIDRAYTYYRLLYMPPEGGLRILGIRHLALDAADVYVRATPKPDQRKVGLHYTLNKDRHILLRIHDRFGQEIWTQQLPSGEAGVYDIHLEFQQFQRGIYLFVLTQVENDLKLADIRIEY
jgi:hypothetical protein